MREIPDQERIVAVSGLKKSFGDVHAVRGIDLSVRRGELYAFLGPNGAGKSTTINMLCTLLRPDSGSITIDGVDVVRKPDSVKKRIGIVFQESLLDKHLSVRENLRTRASFYVKGRANITTAVDRAAEAADVGEFIDRPYGRLSGGQRRRADIARALLNTPRVLFMDEPTTGLDPQTRMHVWQTIQELRVQHDMTIFLTTHYMEEAAGSDYAVIVDDGQIAAEGTPNRLKEEFASDVLKVTPVDPGRFANAIEGLPKERYTKLTQQRDRFLFGLQRTVDAIPLLTELDPLIDEFEVLHGTMDDVFINITGKELR